jgi:iron-sulfur cluster assembly protein
VSKSVMSITDLAAKQIKSLLSNREATTLGIRIEVKSGGCSGKKYYIEYAQSKNQFDEVIEDKGVKIFIDPKALMYLIGSEMDYVDERFKNRFVFNNPNEKASCGCGKSFSA